MHRKIDRAGPSTATLGRVSQQQWNAPRGQQTQTSPWGNQNQPQAWRQQPQWGQSGPWQGQAAQQPQGQWPAPAQPKKKGMSPLVMLLILTLAIGGVMIAVKALQGGGSSPSEQAYQNEAYQVPEATKNVPELPEPKTYTEATDWLENNRLYAQPVVVPVRCEASDIDLQGASKSQLQDHMNQVVGCLMRAWGPSMEKAGFELPRPTVTIYDSQIQTACGKLPMGNAVWCGADQQIYYATNLADVMPASIRGKKWTVEAVVAHEFGHHLQGRTGIFISGIAYQQKSQADEAKRYSRRIELQADCFSGAFLHSVAASKSMTQDDLETIKTMFSGFGDNRRDPSRVGDHGSMASRGYWSQMGLAAQQVQACNTFTASPSSVR